MTGDRLRSIHPGTLAISIAIGRRLKSWIVWYAQCACRREQRRTLARLDDRQLRDIGVSRFDATREAGKPFWK